MTEAERAAAQAIFAEQVETYEARLREQERTFTAIVQELEAEKTGLNARVRMLERQTVELANRLSLSCMETVSPKTWLSITEEAAREADV